MTPQPKFIDGAFEALQRAVAAKPIRHGEDWAASFPCPWCEHTMTVSVPFGVAPLTAEENTVEVDAVCNCRVPHPCGAAEVPYCGQQYRYRLPVVH